ncbi:MAG: hypothetical protein ABIJ15_02370 [bacterium]
MKNRFYIFLCVFFLARIIFAQSPAQIQLSVAAPDPAKAGENITFQVILLNMETVKWPPADVNCRIELFDSEGNYIQKTPPENISGEVQPGGSTLLLVTYGIPSSYTGRYRYRVMLYKKGQNILTSDFYDFNVKASALEKKPVRPVFLNGNVSLSYKNTQRSGYQGSLATNLLGRIYGKTLIFNSNAYSTEDDSFDLDMLFLSVFSDRYKLSAGDVMPDFSPLSIYSLTGRGTNLNYRTDYTDFSGCYIRTQEAAEGDASTNGVYARYTGGMSAKVKLPADFGLKVSGVTTYDSESSVSNPGPSNQAVDNTVMSSELQWSCSFLNVQGEYARSGRQENFYNPSSLSYENSASTPGTAYRFEMRVYRKTFDVRGKYQRIEPDFLNLASPGIYPDRAGMDTSLNYYPVAFLRLNCGYQATEDNLDNDPEVVTTDQTILQGGIQLTPSGLPGISAASSINKVEGSSLTVLNNETAGLSCGINYCFKNQVVAANFSRSQFRNYASTATGNDLDTNGFSVTYSGKIIAAVSVDLGYTANNTKNLNDCSEDEITSFSLGSNISITRDLGFFIYGSLTTREKLPTPLSAEDILTDTTNYSAEVTYKVKKNLSLTGGYTFEGNKTKDDSDDYDSSGVLFRLYYSF